MLTCGLSLMAVPAKRDVRTVTQPDGSTLRIKKTGDERQHFTLTEDGMLLTRAADGTYCYARTDASGLLESTGIKATDPALRTFLPADALNIKDVNLNKVNNSPKRIPQTGMGLDQSSFPGKGSPNVLIILVEYLDFKFMTENPHDYFEEMLNKEGFDLYGGTGSCKDYFRDNSGGQFTPHFDMYGPVTLMKARSYYGRNDAYGTDMHAEQMCVDAIKILDPDVDFSKYDNDGDGILDNVYVIYAGQGEASYGSEDTVWPHSWTLTQAGIKLTVDGVDVNRYACSNEWQEDRPDGIGTFCHEFSHVMGLPDLYNTKMMSDCTPDRYSVLDYGPYNNDGCTPPAYGLFERNALGWCEPEMIEGPIDGKLEHILDSNHGYIIPTSRDTEFFLLENRQQSGWDKYIPGHGMLIWHIDYNMSRWISNTVNNDYNHQYVDVEEAIGFYGTTDAIQEGYTFPGSANVTSFTDDTKPGMATWSGERLELPITEITETDGVIRFLVAGGGQEAIETPVPFKAEEIEKGESYFVAAWEPVENALDYEVSVYAINQGVALTSTCDMGTDKTLTLAEGWTSNTTDSYNTTSNYGEASPSLKFGTDSTWLLSPSFDGNVTEISFWRKGQNTTNSMLDVLGLVGDKWQTIYSDVPTAGKSGTILVTDIPAGVTQVKFLYTKAAGNLALDDVVIKTDKGDILLPDYTDCPTGGATTLRVDKLRDGCDTYAFKVRACGERRPSAYSDLVTVSLGANAIDGIDAETAAPEYYDMLGRRVMHPASGMILIRRHGSTAEKVVVR